MPLEAPVTIATLSFMTVSMSVGDELIAFDVAGAGVALARGHVDGVAVDGGADEALAGAGQGGAGSERAVGDAQRQEPPLLARRQLDHEGVGLGPERRGHGGARRVAPEAAARVVAAGARVLPGRLQARA